MLMNFNELEEVKQEKKARLNKLKETVCKITMYLKMHHFYPEDLSKLITLKTLLTDAYLNMDIFAIFPIFRDGRWNSLVFAEMGIYYVAKPPLTIVKELYQHTNYFDLESTKAAMAKLLKKGKYKMPYANRYYVLMPLSSPDRQDTIWLNPAHIDDTFVEDGTTFAMLSFGLTVAVPVSRTALISQMTNSFRLYGIFLKRDLQCWASDSTSLHSLLGIRSSPLIRAALKGLKVSDLHTAVRDVPDCLVNAFLEIHDRQFGVTAPRDTRKKNRKNLRCPA